MTSMPQESAEIFKQDTKGRVRVPKARREAMLDEYERSGGSAAQFANYVGIKYSTLANWIQKRRKQERLKRSLLKQGEGAGQWSQTNGRWVEAVVEKGAEPKAQESSLRIYFTAGAYCQISNAREAGLAAELLGCLGARRC
jgi:transposase-like protein